MDRNTELQALGAFRYAANRFEMKTGTRDIREFRKQCEATYTPNANSGRGTDWWNGAEVTRYRIQ